MKKFALLFLAIKTFAYVPEQLSDTEGLPCTFIENSVNVITGDVHLEYNDITVQGLQPIHIPRAYISSSDQPYGGWFLYQHLIAKLDAFYPNNLYICEPNGTELLYNCTNSKLEGPRNKKDLKKPPFTFKIPRIFYASGITNQSHNYEQSAAYLQRNFNAFILDTTDGTQRHYQRINLPGPFNLVYYLLIWERHPNKNLTIYSYTENYNLSAIHTKNPNGSQVYAWAKFDWKRNKKKTKVQSLSITTSDKQELTYHFQTHKDKNYLSQINLAPIQYLEKNNQGYLLHHESDPLTFEYYGLEDLNSPTDERFKKVKALYHKNGKSYRFFYEPNKTEVLDSENNRTVYHYTQNLRVHTIEYYQEDTLTHTEKHLWNAHRYHGLSHIDNSNIPIYSKIYHYDNLGNLSEEKYYTTNPSSPPLLLTTDHYPLENNCPCETKTYTYNNHNLLSQTENDTTTTYTYLPNTNLPTSKITTHKTQIQTRLLYEYNPDGIIIQETTDAGPNTPAHITKITPRSQSNLYGLPEVIEHYQEDTLTTRIHLTYSPSGQLLRQDFFDPNGTYTHSLP